MVELISDIHRRKSGLYDLTIKAADGRTVLAVNSITFNRAVALIGETEQKADGGRRNDVS